MNLVYPAMFVVVLAAVAMAAILLRLRRIDERNDDEGLSNGMVEMSSAIRSGAWTFLRTQFITIVIVAMVIAALFSLFIEKTAGLTFMLGAAMSSLACFSGMISATYANVRTANTALKTDSISETVRVALMGGSVAGLSVQTFALAGLFLVLIIWKVDMTSTASGYLMSLGGNPFVMRLTTYSLGCSIVAMFNRVAGGIFTKGADIAADTVGKMGYGLPEDDPRNPAVLADNVGDNVGDVAGAGSDLAESYAATIVAAIAMTAILFDLGVLKGTKLFNAMVSFAIALAGGGLASCLIALVTTIRRNMSDNPSKELNTTTYISAGLTAAISLLASRYIFGSNITCSDFVLGWISPWISAVIGIASGIAIGVITERYTSPEFNTVQELARSAKDGPSFIVSAGFALGSRSCLLPLSIIGLFLFVSDVVSGSYGIAISALGMLSFVATTVSIDAFGPIADNAGGIAEACKLPKKARAITDKLDAVGNTTAAIGKGFAIGSAAFAAISLIISYIASYNTGVVPVLNIATSNAVFGGLVGIGLVEYFTYLLIKYTVKLANTMATEASHQLDDPDILSGTKKPDYDRLIQIGTTGALKMMVVPSLIALVAPAIGGFVFGPEVVGGLLIGSLFAAVPKAVFMGNSGGAWDNAKKYIESGALGELYGKNTAAHIAAIIGDMIGDIFKDVVGPSLDILIKTMSTTATTLAALFVAFAR